jgi:hypothetical protein
VKRSVALLALGAVMACSSSDTDIRTSDSINAAPDILLPTVSRDSNGVEQLTFPADAFSRVPQFTLDSVPLAIAGGANGSRDFDLTYARHVHVLSDHRLVAFAPIGARLLVFGADGAEERIIGRLGGGPGEFMRPGGVVVLPGDTLFLSDVANNRLNWVMPDGRFVRTPAMSWDRLVYDAETSAGMLPDGRLVLHSSGRFEQSESDTVFRSVAKVEVQPLTGARQLIATVPDLAEITVTQRLRGRDVRQTVLLLFSPRAHVVLWDSLVTTSPGHEYRISVRTPSGLMFREITIPLQRRAVTEAMKAQMLARQLAVIDAMRSEGGGETYSKSEQRARVQLTPSADSAPMIQGLFVTPNRTLWVLDDAAVSDADKHMLTAYRQDGAMIGRLAIPRNALPMAFGDDRVVLRVLDEDDVVALHVHRIRTTNTGVTP